MIMVMIMIDRDDQDDDHLVDVKVEALLHPALRLLELLLQVHHLPSQQLILVLTKISRISLWLSTTTLS